MNKKRISDVAYEISQKTLMEGIVRIDVIDPDGRVLLRRAVLPTVPDKDGFNRVKAEGYFVGTIAEVRLYFNGKLHAVHRVDPWVRITAGNLFSVNWPVTVTVT